MKLAQDIVIKPIITERSMSGIAQGKYTFEVQKDANKIEIASAIETLFPGTKVASVNTMNVRGKQKRVGRYFGNTARRRKAIVALTEDSNDIKIFKDENEEK